VKAAGKFSWIPRDMLAAIGMSAEEKIVWLALNSFTEEDGECFASIARVAERCGLSKSSVQRYLPALVKDGWLEIVVRASHKPTRYKLLQPTIVKQTIVRLNIVDSEKKSTTTETPSTIVSGTIVNQTIVEPTTIVSLTTDYSQPDTLSRTVLEPSTHTSTRTKEKNPPNKVPVAPPKQNYRAHMNYDTQRFEITDTAYAKLEQDYPAVDLDVEIKNAENWCIDNAEKRRIENGLSFLSKWLSKPTCQKRSAGTVRMNTGALAGQTLKLNYRPDVQQNKRPGPIMDMSKIVKGD
jgi:hypothetical protein